jgi:hypothetical protein
MDKTLAGEDAQSGAAWLAGDALEKSCKGGALDWSSAQTGRAPKHEGPQKSVDVVARNQQVALNGRGNRLKEGGSLGIACWRDVGWGEGRSRQCHTKGA